MVTFSLDEFEVNTRAEIVDTLNEIGNAIESGYNSGVTFGGVWWEISGGEEPEEDEYSQDEIISCFLKHLENTDYKAISNASEDEVYQFARDKFMQIESKVVEELNIDTTEYGDDVEWYDEIRDEVVLLFCSKIFGGKRYTRGEPTIDRDMYESMPIPMDTSSLTDEDMQRLADAIKCEMKT